MGGNTMANPDAPKDAVKEPPKGATAPVKKARPDADDEGEDGKATVLNLKPKLLPTGLSRSIVLAAIIASMAMVTGSLFGNRYNLVPAPNSANGIMYRIDHLTGAVQFCGPQGCAPVAHQETAK
jgi:hypothetical protein